jgi:VanZ family protein
MDYGCDMRLSRSSLVLWISVGVATLLLLAPLPLAEAVERWPALMEEVENLGHPLVVAWLSHLVFLRLRSGPCPTLRMASLWVLVLAACYGAATELLQSLTGRDASVRDALNDVLGAAFVLLLHARRETSGRARWGIISVAALIGITCTAPLTVTISAYVVRAAKAPVIWNDQSMLLGQFAGWKNEDLSAFVISEPLPDWREWLFIEMDIRNLQQEPLDIVVRVHDRSHDQSHHDRYNGSFILPPQVGETLRIPLEEIRMAPASRQMNLGAIQGIVVFSTASSQASPFHVSEIRLSR